MREVKHGKNSKYLNSKCKFLFIQTIKSSSPLMYEREGFVNWALVAAWGGKLGQQDGWGNVLQRGRLGDSTLEAEIGSFAHTLQEKSHL